MKEVLLHNPTKKDLVFPLNNVEFPAGKTVKVEKNTAIHIVNTWKFLEFGGNVTVEKVKGKVLDVVPKKSTAKKVVEKVEKTVKKVVKKVAKKKVEKVEKKVIKKKTQ